MLVPLGLQGTQQGVQRRLTLLRILVYYTKNVSSVGMHLPVPGARDALTHTCHVDESAFRCAHIVRSNVSCDE